MDKKTIKKIETQHVKVLRRNTDGGRVAILIGKLKKIFILVYSTYSSKMHL
jgi:hypothetical protein